MFDYRSNLPRNNKQRQQKNANIRSNCLAHSCHYQSICLQHHKMTIDFTSQDALFGKNFTVYQNQMTETEKLKEQIKLLQSKLSFLEELEQTKSPAEEAYKRVYGNYPVTDITDACWSGSTWTNFATGYNAAQEDYKVGEYQEPEEEPEELMEKLGFVKNSDGNWTAQPLVETAQEPEPKENPKTLYQIFRENDRSEAVSHVLCDIVKEWMFQYDCDYVGVGKGYLEGYQECQTVLEERLR